MIYFLRSKQESKNFFLQCPQSFIHVSDINLTMPNTVDPRCCGHPRGEDLVSVIARVRNSGERKELFSL